MVAANMRLNPYGILAFTLATVLVVVYITGFRFTKREETISLRQLLSVSIEAAEKGGEQVKLVRETANGLNAVEKSKTKEGKSELKTNGDMQSHRTMMAMLLKAFPKLETKIISEEHEDSKNTLNVKLVPSKERLDVVKIISKEEYVPVDNIVVWIDPLDATQEYSENLLQYVTTMVCVSVKGRPVIGVIHKPFEKTTYWGYIDHGHSDNLMKTNDNKRNSESSGFKVIVSHSHKGDVESVAREAFGQKAEVIGAGGAGYKTLELIKGNVDAYLHTTEIKKWDICSGNAILKSVGGEMTTLENVQIDYSAAGSPKNKAGLLATMKDHSTSLSKLKQILNNVKHKDS